MRKAGIGLLLLVSGCASTGPYPVYTSGDYYMIGGDQSCANYQKYDDFKRIRCQDAKGKITGDREAMTLQQMQVYQAQVAAAKPSQVYVPNHQVQPVVYQPMVIPQPSNYDNRNQVRCLSTDIYTSCKRY